MINNKISYLGRIIFLLFILFIAFVEFFLRQQDNQWYLPNRGFWKLNQHTNLDNHFFNQESFILWHTGVPFHEEIIVKKQPGVIRIILLGTSSTEGYKVSKMDNYASQLQQLLNKKYGNGKFEIINAAVGGYVSYQLLIFFKEVLFKLSPDMVILYLGHNDTFYYSFFTARDYYEKLRNIFDNSEINSEMKKRLIHYGLNAINPFYSFLAESRLFGYFLIKISEMRFMNRIQLSPAKDQEYVLSQFIVFSKKYNFKLIFIPEFVTKSMQRSLFGYYNLMQNLANKDNIPLILLAPVFNDYPVNVILLDNVHLTNFGHTMVAQKIFDQLQK
ncbi:MAG: SGNH/GDSL hydrolase family protein [Candidatus Omnitrophota bacterium]